MWFEPYKVFMYCVNHPAKAEIHAMRREKIRKLRQLREEHKHGTKIKKESRRGTIDTPISRYMGIYMH